jgi:AcrR family transcriptional regulator
VQALRATLFLAAAETVGKVGYADASVALITQSAGVAQGTFYKHFESRQALFDDLLPTLGLEMLEYVRERTPTSGAFLHREEARFRAFFDYIVEHPNFYRILNEAEFFAARGYERHFDNVVAGYTRVLSRALERGEIRRFTPDDTEVIVYLLLSLRSYVGMRFVIQRGRVRRPPPEVVATVMRFIEGALVAPQGEKVE